MCSMKQEKLRFAGITLHLNILFKVFLPVCFLTINFLFSDCIVKISIRHHDVHFVCKCFDIVLRYLEFSDEGGVLNYPYRAKFEKRSKEEILIVFPKLTKTNKLPKVAHAAVTAFRCSIPRLCHNGDNEQMENGQDVDEVLESDPTPPASRMNGPRNSKCRYQIAPITHFSEGALDIIVSYIVLCRKQVNIFFRQC